MRNAGRLKATTKSPICGATAAISGRFRGGLKVGGEPRRKIDPRVPRKNERKVVGPARRDVDTLPTAYSMVRSQPMIHATTSPNAMYE